MTSTHLDDAKMAEMIEKMPAFPKSVQQVLSLADDINCNPRDLVRVVEHDPVLTGRMLKVVNSAYFGLSRRISSVKEALAFIGLNTLKNVALTLAAVGALPTKNDAGLRMDDFLAYSLSVGGAARWLASRSGLGIRESDRAFLAGLLHEFGQVVLALHMPTTFKDLKDRAERFGIPLYQLENDAFGTDHYALGGLVARKWQLEDKIADTIWYHRHGIEEDKRTPLMDCLWAGVALVHHFDGKHLGGPKPSTLEKNLSLSMANLMDEKEAISKAIERTQIFKQI